MATRWNKGGLAVKKIAYSSFTKVVAALLAICCLAAGVNIAINAVADYFAENERIYNFESDFSQATWFYPLFYDVNIAVRGAYSEVYGNNIETAPQNTEVTVMRDPSEVTVVRVPKESLNAGMTVYYDDPYARENGGQSNAETEKSNQPKIFVMKIPDENTDVIYSQADDKTEAVLDKISQNLKGTHIVGKAEYFISVNGRKASNTHKTFEQLKESEVSFWYERTGNGVFFGSNCTSFSDTYVLDDISSFNSTDSITLCVSVAPMYLAQCKDVWYSQEGGIRQAFFNILILALLVLLIMIYLCAVSGKTADGKIKTSWVDKIWTELHLAAAIGATVAVVAAGAVMCDMYVHERFPLYMFRYISLAATVVGAAIVISCILSVVRKIKSATFIKTSLMGRVLGVIWYIVKKAYHKLKSTTTYIKKSALEKTAVIYAVLLVMYTGIIMLCGVLTPESEFFLVIGICLFLFMLFVLLWRAADLGEIKKGICEIQSGNYSYKVGEVKSEDLKATAEKLGEIAAGLDKTVAEKTKAERMKTELITNVSHDIKTPLTSIINYSSLLMDMQDMPEQARDYVKIISSKGERLKKLTQDLFDISKANSGNDNIQTEKLNVALLIQQSLAEQDNDISCSELEFCLNTDKNLNIMADGKKMSRVLGNIINNIIKYSMKNTRVYIRAYESDKKVVMEFKNISAYPMDFDADEITARFVRGDKSRSTEGNGLGLAIARSYTEMCGGTFKIITDGDLFKAVLMFDVILDENTDDGV